MQLKDSKMPLRSQIKGQTGIPENVWEFIEKVDSIGVKGTAFAGGPVTRVRQRGLVMLIVIAHYSLVLPRYRVTSEGLSNGNCNGTLFASRPVLPRYTTLNFLINC